MKFLHCADLHLGCAGGQERLRAFDRMLDFCAAEKVEVLLIAGDLFDAPRVEEGVRGHVWKRLDALPGLCTLIAPGNHDPLGEGGNYDEMLPENVYVFGKEWSCAEIPAYGVRVWGAGFAGEQEEPFVPVRKRRKLTEGLLDLGVLHADLVSPGGSSPYRALSAGRIAETSLKYLALGHIHERSEILRAGDTHYAYSGCLQGLAFDEVGEKGAYLGEIGADGILHMSFVKLCGSMTVEKKVSLSGCMDLTGAARLCAEALRGLESHRVRLILTGTPRDFAVDPEGLTRLLSGCGVRLRLEDETRAETNAEEIARENTLRGAFARRMLRRLEEAEEKGEETEIVREALRLGLSAFDGEVTHDEN